MISMNTYLDFQQLITDGQFNGYQVCSSKHRFNKMGCYSKIVEMSF